MSEFSKSVMSAAAVFAAAFLGMAFSGPASAATLKVLHEFTGPDGSDPTGGVVIDPTTGVVYGTTPYGGSGDGTVFSLTPPVGGTGKWKLQTIYAFQGGLDGSRPDTGLALVPTKLPQPALFGTTRTGSSLCDGCGTVFSLIPNRDGVWDKAKVHEFSGDSFDGVSPSSTPFVSDHLDIYGTTANIGGSGGAVYRMLLDGGNFTVVYNPGQNIGNFVGYHPQGVVVDGSGTIFGTAFDGAYSGTIFRIDGTGGIILHGFNGPDGAYPEARPVMAADGTLYGTTFQGGNPKDCPNSPGCGVVWKRTPSGRQKVLHSFRFFTHHKDGLDVISPLVLDPTTGTLYGTTKHGGTGTACGGSAGSCGTVFQIDSAGNYQVIWEFPKGGVAEPQGQLVFYAGELYGTSYDGGKPCPDQHYIGCGTVWRLTP